jgi:uncharacterized RDD family membrane protein YckC
MSGRRVAGVWRRYAAWSLDFACVMALALPLAWARMREAARALHASFVSLSDLLAQRLGDALGAMPDPATLAARLLADPAVHAAAAAMQSALVSLLLIPLAAYALLALAWHAGFQATRWQASPGQRALGLWVARADGPRAGWPRLAARQCAAALSWLSLNLGHALALLPPHRALHDVLSGTSVFDASGTRGLPPWARGWIALQALALLLGVGWLLARYVGMLQAMTA